MRTGWIQGALFGAALTAMLGAGFGAMAHEKRRSRDVIIDGDAVKAQVTEALDELAAIERLNDRNRDKRTRGRIHDGIHELRMDLEGVQATLNAARVVDDAWDKDWHKDRDLDRAHDRDRDHDRDRTRDHDRTRRDDPDQDTQVVYAMSEAEIDKVIAEMAKTGFSQTKLQVARDAVSGRWVMTSQVIRLMEELSFSSDRVELAAMLYPNVGDPDQFYQVYSHLPFDSDRDALRKKIGK